jgi:predicted secreted protein
MDKLQEEIKKEAEKLEELLKQAGYRMINFNINKLHSTHTGLDITIWAVKDKD